MLQCTRNFYVCVHEPHVYSRTHNVCCVLANTRLAVGREFPLPSHSHRIPVGIPIWISIWISLYGYPYGDIHMGIPTEENHIPIPNTIPWVWGSILGYPYGYSNWYSHTHGIVLRLGIWFSSVGIPMWISPYGYPYWDPYGDPHRRKSYPHFNPIPMGMRVHMEIHIPTATLALHTQF